MTTSSVSYTVPSNGWTGSINVSDCNLDTDISVDDYKIFYDGVEQGSSELSNWDKVSSISLSYSGSSLNLNDVVLIRRHTPAEVIQTVQPLETISSTQWNAEFDRCARRDEEIRLYGTTLDSAVGVSDETYSSGWDGVTTQAPSKNAVYDKLNTLSGGESSALVDDTAYNATTWNGVTTRTASKNAIRDKIETITGGETGALVDNTAYATSWNGVTGIAPSKNAVFDAIEEHRNFGQMNGRLTLTSGTPITASNTIVTGTTLYYTPYLGNNVYLYDGSRWNRHTLGGDISLDCSGFTQDVLYDIFLYDNAGTLTLESTAWSTTTARATALAWQNGILVRSGSTTRRYLGTVCRLVGGLYQTASYSGSSNTLAHNTVCNWYNQVQGSIRHSGVAFAALSAAAWTLVNTNMFSIVINPYHASTVRPFFMSGLRATNSSGAARDVAISGYNGIAGSPANETAYIALPTGQAIDLEVVYTIPGIGYQSAETRYFISATAGVSLSLMTFEAIYPL